MLQYAPFPLRIRLLIFHNQVVRVVRAGQDFVVSLADLPTTTGCLQLGHFLLGAVLCSPASPQEHLTLLDPSWSATPSACVATQAHRAVALTRCSHSLFVKSSGIVYKSMENSPASVRSSTISPNFPISTTRISCSPQHWICSLTLNLDPSLAGHARPSHASTDRGGEKREARCPVPREKRGRGLTFDVTPNVCIRTLVLVDQLNHSEKILLLQLLQRLRDLLIVVLLLRALPAAGTANATKALLLPRPVIVVGQGTRLA